MLATNRAGIAPVRRPSVPPEVRQMLEESRRWNAYADRMNRKALAAGIVTADQLDAAHWASERAIRGILEAYDWEADADLRAWHDELDRMEGTP